MSRQPLSRREPDAAASTRDDTPRAAQAAAPRRAKAQRERRHQRCEAAHHARERHHSRAARRHGGEGALPRKLRQRMRTGASAALAATRPRL